MRAISEEKKKELVDIKNPMKYWTPHIVYI
jgi:hypothetical protein